MLALGLMLAFSLSRSVSSLIFASLGILIFSMTYFKAPGYLPRRRDFLISARCFVITKMLL